MSTNTPSSDGAQQVAVPFVHNVGTTFDTILLKSHRQEILQFQVSLQYTEELMDALEGHWSMTKYVSVLFRMRQHGKKLKKIADWNVHNGFGAGEEELYIRRLCRLCREAYEDLCDRRRRLLRWRT
jgi:hypothetical protein